METPGTILNLQKTLENVPGVSISYNDGQPSKKGDTWYLSLKKSPNLIYYKIFHSLSKTPQKSLIIQIPSNRSTPKNQQKTN
jgi:hypothetical protein